MCVCVCVLSNPYQVYLPHDAQLEPLFLEQAAWMLISYPQLTYVAPYIIGVPHSDTDTQERGYVQFDSLVSLCAAVWSPYSLVMLMCLRSLLA